MPIPSSKFISSAFVAIMLLTLSCSLPAAPANLQAATAVHALQSRAGNSLKLSYSKTTGQIEYLSAARAHPILLSTPPGASADKRAMAFMSTYGKAFGLSTSTQLKPGKWGKRDEAGMEHVRLQQLHKGIPVTGGEITVHLNDQGVASVMAKTIPGLDSVDVMPKITPDEAERTARELFKKQHIDNAGFTKPKLEVFNAGLFQGKNQPTSHLAWFIEAKKIDVRQYLWIDAQTGVILMNFSQLPDALSRKINTASNASNLPGALIQSEGEPSSGDPDADAAYLFSGQTYNYFKSKHGRDSYDGLGAPLISTVHYCPDNLDCPYQNAFWNGDQMVYGDGFSVADDVDAHELTHAVTENSANLYYYAESGALNESFSDIFGETVDLTNATGNDAASVRWLIGEEIPGVGAIRSMKNPTLFGHPGKVTDASLQCDVNDGDQGGVHSNSGIPNHAFFLMTAGGTYNGQTITGIGLAKAGKIQYRALTQYLTSGSNFLDDFNALQSACTDLIGQAGITADNCAQVTKALTAVQMNAPVCTKPAVTAPCPSGTAVKSLFFDDLEASGSNFATNDFTIWSIIQGNAKSGALSMFGKNTEFTSDAYYKMTKSVAIPANARMQFDHTFDFESLFDGGIVEYSLNNGVTWLDAGALINSGTGYKYNGVLSGTNPLVGKSAFTGSSFGYTSTQLNLNTLAGKKIRFRFRAASDSSVAYSGWFIDNIQIYQCQ